MLRGRLRHSNIFCNIGEQMIKQRTVKNSISTKGIGLHSGHRVSITIRPADINTGIMFRRIDLDGGPAIKASGLMVGDTRMCSCLEDGHVKIATIEHAMSALAGLGIDNAWIDLDSPEVPILDGSASPFVFLLQQAGICEQNAPKKFLRIKERVEVVDGDKKASFEPYDGYALEFNIHFNHPAIQKTDNHVSFDFGRDSYLKEIARARTFGFAQEVEFLRENNLALGGGLFNAVVLDEYRVLNNEGLRYDSEFVRHKILDAIGDLYLIGYPILGKFEAFKSGHDLNNKLVRAVLANENAYEIITFEEKQAPEAVKHWLSTEVFA